MLAKVSPDRPEEIQAAPPSITMRFDPETGLFLLKDTEENSVANLVLIEESTQEISITIEGATFIDHPISWVLPPPSDPPNPEADGDTVTFTVSQPEHFFAPWAFGIIVDTPSTKGIRSQNIFLTKPFGSSPAAAQVLYDPSDGTFALSDGTTGLDVKSQSFLINASLPSQTPSFSVDLVLTSPSSGVSINFAPSPIMPSSGTLPEWLPVELSDTDTSNMALTIHPSGMGHSIGFSFVIQVTKDETTTTVISPDPILINATIGDG